MDYHYQSVFVFHKQCDVANISQMILETNSNIDNLDLDIFVIHAVNIMYICFVKKCQTQNIE